MASQAPLTIWIRHETKAYEERVTITPREAKQMLDDGFDVHVEHSETRVYKDKEYQDVGCKMEPTGSWATLKKDPNLAIVGLKELPEDTFSIVNSHVYFAHAFKGQEGWEKVLKRYVDGGGVIYDYEFLENPEGQNVGAAMSPFAGFVGCAQAIRTWCHQRLFPDQALPAITTSTKAEIIDSLKAALDEVMSSKVIEAPTAMVLGALGRCGRGAVECAKAVGLNVLEWDQEETKKGGPFTEILDVDVFVNCILLSMPIPPFITNDLIDSTPDRKLTVICDVSCDPNSKNNPVPVYNHITSWAQPALRIRDDPPLDVISVDNLPSVLALEASQTFASLLYPALLEYPHGAGWAKAKVVFDERCLDLMVPQGEE